MDSDRLAQLTDKQRECLRLVLQHHSSKEIARKLGIGADAVDRRLKAAMKTLGVHSRVEAARMLGGSERMDISLPEPAGRPPQRVDMEWVKSKLGPLPTRNRRARFVIAACVLALILGHFSGPADLWLRDIRTEPRSKLASGNIAFVAIDDRSLDAIARVPWPRRHLAKLVNAVDRMGARRIFFNFLLDRKTTVEDDRALAEAFRPLRYRLILPLGYGFDSKTGNIEKYGPLPEFEGEAYIVDSAPRTVQDRKIFETAPGYVRLPSPSGVLGGHPRRLDDFPVDYSIDPASVPRVSAIDVLNGTADRTRIAGKDVVIGTAYRPYTESDTLAPGYGMIPGSYDYILAAETLIAGPPTQIPRAFGLMLALILAISCVLANRGLISIAMLTGGICLFAILPFFLEPHLIYLEIVPPVLLLLFAGVGLVLAWVWDARSQRAPPAAVACHG